MSEKGKEKNKSQSKPTKNCRCENQENCPHPWQLSDDGAGTIVKAHNKYIWGHKASIGSITCFSQNYMKIGANPININNIAP